MPVLARLRTALSGIASSKDDLEARELSEQARSAGVDHVAACASGQAVTLRGTICSVTVDPHASVPHFEAELYDGTGRIRLVWLGRRTLPGVEAGRRVEVHGRVTCRLGDQPAMFNPAYDLSPRASA